MNQIPRDDTIQWRKQQNRNGMILSDQDFANILMQFVLNPSGWVTDRSLHKSKQNAKKKSGSKYSARKRDDISGLASSTTQFTPKRPLTAYNLFFREQRERLSAMPLYQAHKDSINVARVVSMTWKQMRPAARVHYDQMAANDKFRYYNEKMAYHGSSESCNIPSSLETGREEENAEQRGAVMERDATTITPLSQAQGSVTRSSPRLLLPPSSSLSGHIASRQSSNLVWPSSMQLDQEPLVSRKAIASLASKLDPNSVDLLIKALK